MLLIKKYYFLASKSNCFPRIWLVEQVYDKNIVENAKMSAYVVWITLNYNCSHCSMIISNRKC